MRVYLYDSINAYWVVMGDTAPWLKCAETAMMDIPSHGLSRTIRFMVLAGHADDC